MSEPAPDQDPNIDEELGSLTVEDDPDGTVDPSELAGGADESDADTALHPDYSEEDLED